MKTKEEQEKATVNGVELKVVDPQFHCANPDEYIVIKYDVLMQRAWYECLDRLMNEGLDPTDGYFNSIGSFISQAVQEKLERTFVDYEALGRLYQKRLQKDHRPCHLRIKGVNDGISDKQAGRGRYTAERNGD